MPTRGIRAALLVAMLLAMGVGLAPVGAGPALAADDGLAIVTKATYTLAPKNGVVHVSVTIKATNNKPNLVEQTPNGALTTRYFFDRATLVVQREATKLRATAGATRLTVTPHPATNYTVVDVGFAADLFFHQSTSFRLNFDLPGGAPRSAGDIRVGSAFASFYTWAFGDQGDVRIIVPAGFTVTSTGSKLDSSVIRGATNLTASGVTDITNWYAVVVADRHDALTQERVDLPGGEHLVLRAWPEDKEWLSRVGDLLRKGLPTLVDLVGLDWPVAGDIEVDEVHTPLLEGYAGVFHVGENRIEISEDLDELTIVHEASHAWFNSGLFVGRWIDEGFADEYASLVLDKVSNGGFKPDPTEPGGTGHVPLNDWTFPGRITDTETDLREQFGYNASWTIVRALVDEIGVGPMRAVIAAAADKQIPYVGAGSPERLDGAADWRRFLDLLEGVGGSKQATDLFDRWVVLDSEKPLLAARTEARTAYAALVEAGGNWLPGIAVREPMAGWDFATARTRIEAALAILETRDRIAALASDIGVAPPTTLQSAYEAATDLAPVATMADAQLTALQELATTKTAVAGARDVFTSVGLIGSDPSADLAAAVTAFGAGDTAGARAAASHAAALITAAPADGRTRLIGGAGLLAGGFLLAGGSVALYRRRRLDLRPGVLAAEPGVDEPAPVSQAYPAEPVASAEPARLIELSSSLGLPTSSPIPEPPRPVEPSPPAAAPTSAPIVESPPTSAESDAVAAYMRRRLERGPLPPIGDGASADSSAAIEAYRRRRIERDLLTAAGEAATTESPTPIPERRWFPKAGFAGGPQSAAVPPSVAETPSDTPPSVAKPEPAATPPSVAKPKSAAKRKSGAKSKSGATSKSAAKTEPTVKPQSTPPPDPPDSYATLGAPPADAAGQDPAAPGGEEEL